MTDPTANAIAAAWFVDPTDASQWRWWDGSQWTDHVAPLVPAAERQAEAVEAAETAPLVAVAEPAVERWAVPAPDAPLFPRNDYPKDVHPAFVAERRRLHLVRAPMTGIRIAGGGFLLGMGIVLFESAAACTVTGAAVIRRALWDVHDDARDVPWNEMFRRRGLEAGRVAHPRWPELQVLLAVGEDGGTAHPRWSAGGDLAGMPAVCGETYVESQDEDNLLRTYRMFAAFSLPPRAGVRHRKVSVRRRSVPAAPGRAPKRMRETQFESIAVTKALKVHVDEAANDVYVRELFGPQLLAALAEHPVEWEQRRELLVVFSDVPSEPGREFDAFIRSAAAVARAYWTDQD